MALQGNFRKTLGSQDKAPELKAAVRHGDVTYLPGQKCPERFSRRKVEALKRAGIIE